MPKTAAQNINNVLTTLYREDRMRFPKIKVAMEGNCKFGLFEAGKFYLLDECRIVDDTVSLSLRKGRSGRYDTARCTVSVTADTIIHWRKA